MKTTVTRVFLLTLLVLCLSATALMAGADEYKGPAWTFEVTLQDLDPNFMIAASESEPLEDTYVPSRLTTLKQSRNSVTGGTENVGINLATNAAFQLQEAAATALYRMCSDAQQQGVTLYIRQAYRTFEESNSRYERFRKRSAGDVTPPAQDDYRTGLAVTIVGKDWRAKTLEASRFSSSTEAAWLNKNCTRYGFVVRYPEGKDKLTGNSAEPWHLRYVGESIATFMNKNNYCLEEFLEEYQIACDEFAARGGNIAEALLAYHLPEGPIQLEDMGPDGDHEIVLFHD